MRCKPQTIREWRLKLQISIELLGGYHHILKADCPFTPKELIGDMPYEYTDTYSYYHFRTIKRSPAWNFGDPKPKKEKTHAEYVWRTLV